MKIHHVGYLVTSMAKAKKAFLALGYEPASDDIYDDVRKIDICFMKKDGYNIELISPAAENSVVSGLIKRYRNSPYHICYESADFEKQVGQLRRDGYMYIGQPCPAPALSGRHVVFLMNPISG